MSQRITIDYLSNLGFFSACLGYLGCLGPDLSNMFFWWQRFCLLKFLLPLLAFVGWSVLTLICIRSSVFMIRWELSLYYFPECIEVPKGRKIQPPPLLQSTVIDIYLYSGSWTSKNTYTSIAALNQTVSHNNLTTLGGITSATVPSSNGSCPMPLCGLNGVFISFAWVMQVIVYCPTGAVAVYDEHNMFTCTLVYLVYYLLCLVCFLHMRHMAWMQMYARCKHLYVCRLLCFCFVHHITPAYKWN